MNKKYDINWLLACYENGDTLKFIYFWSHLNKYNEEVGKFCFSQWFECLFIVDNQTYKTSEHWMMAQKAKLFGDSDSFNKIVKANKPGEAKELGRQVLGYNDSVWNKWKFELVKIGNIHKFNQNPKLALFLLETGNRVLVEASPMDTIWGIGLSQDSTEIENIYAWRGENLLGFALMETRAFLQSFGHFKALPNAIKTPAEKFPNIESNDIFWTFGEGKEYLLIFKDFYSKLSEREKMIYKLTKPLSFEWFG